MNKQVKDKKVYKLNIIKTPGSCYVNNKKQDRWGGSIEHFFFNGQKPEKTNKDYWYKIKEFPTVIQKQTPDKTVNVRYELKEGYPESELTPKVVNESSLYETKYDAVSGLYQRMSDTIKGELESIEFELNIIAERDASFEVHDDKIDGEKLSYALLDEIETNPMLLHEKPCKINGLSMYKIVRKFLKDNVDGKAARVETNYDWQTKVYKIIRIANPYTTKHNRNANDKRRKPRWIETYHDKNEKCILSFENSSRVKRYPPEISGKDIYDLQKNLDKYLNDMLTKINTPYVECKHCDGVGVLIEK